MSRVKINSVVAYNVDTHEVYVLNDLFHYSDGFKGATGATLMPLTQEYIDYCSTEENGLEYLDGCGILKDEYIQMAKEQIEDEKETFIDKFVDDNIDELVYEKNKEILWEFVNNTGGLFIGHDDSYVNCVTTENVKLLDSKFQMDIESFECIGCGRMWDKDMFQNPNIVWLDEELKHEIQIYEGYIVE